MFTNIDQLSKGQRLPAGFEYFDGKVCAGVYIETKLTEPTMHCSRIHGHAQSMTTEKILTEYFWDFFSKITF